MCPPKPASILFFSDDEVLHKANLLGVSLGFSHAERVASMKIIKDNELQRFTLTILEKKIQIVITTGIMFLNVLYFPVLQI
jgi:hypothetical protein